MRLLVTAFEPFDGSGVNSSAEALRAYMAGQPEPVRRGQVVAGELPVQFGADQAAVLALLSGTRPDAILHLGQSRAGVVHVERLAVNLRVADTNQYGSSLEGSPRAECSVNAACGLVPIIGEGPPGYWSALPVERLVAAVAAAGVPVADSAHAGSYLCNHVMYQSLHRHARHGWPDGPPAGFVHLPRLPQQGQMLGQPAGPILALSRLVTAVGVLIDTLLTLGPGGLARSGSGMSPDLS